MKIRLGNETLILFVILSGAFAIRFLFWRFGYLYGSDPYFHYGNYRELIESGNILFPLGLYSIPLFLNSILSLFGISNYDVFRITASIIGILTILATYLLVKEVFGRKTALFSAIILSFTPTFIFRTMVGNFRGDPFSNFFIVLCFYFFVIMIKNKQETRKRILTAIIGGIFLALSAFVWSSGFIFAALIITSAILIIGLKAYISGEDNRDRALSYFLLVGISIFIIYSFNNLGILYNSISSISGFSDFSKLIFPGILMLLGALELSRNKLSGLNDKNRTLVALCGGILLFVALIAIKPDLFDKFANLYRPRYGTGSLQTVGELMPITGDLLVYLMSIIPAIAFLGMFFLLLKKRFSRTHIFLIIWLLAGTYVMIKIGNRGTFIASVPYAIFAGLGMTSMQEYLKKINILQGMKSFKPQNLISGIILIYIAVDALFFTFALGPLMTDNWNDALSWERENLPEDSVVLSWWDYGYYISTLGGGKPLIDPGQNQARIREVADIFFEEDERKVQEFLVKYQVDYILIPTDMTFQIINIQTIRGIKDNRIFSLYNYYLLPYLGEFNNMGVVFDNYNNQLFTRKQNNRILEGFMQEGNLYSAHIYYQMDDTVIELPENPIQSYNKGSFYVSNNNAYIFLFNASEFAVFIPKNMENNFLTSLIFLQGKNFEETLELVYLNPQIKIYKANYDNNEE